MALLATSTCPDLSNYFAWVNEIDLYFEDSGIMVRTL